MKIPATVIALAITSAALGNTWEQWGKEFGSQQTCAYWYLHFTNLEKARLKLEALRRAGAHPIWIWAAKRKLRQVFLKQQWDAFGELVDEADRIYPDREDDPEAPWFERPRWK